MAQVVNQNNLALIINAIIEDNGVMSQVLDHVKKISSSIKTSTLDKYKMIIDKLSVIIESYDTTIMKIKGIVDKVGGSLSKIFQAVKIIPTEINNISFSILSSLKTIGSVGLIAYIKVSKGMFFISRSISKIVKTLLAIGLNPLIIFGSTMASKTVSILMDNVERIFKSIDNSIKGLAAKIRVKRKIKTIFDCLDYIITRINIMPRINVIPNVWIKIKGISFIVKEVVDIINLISSIPLLSLLFIDKKIIKLGSTLNQIIFLVIRVNRLTKFVPNPLVVIKGLLTIKLLKTYLQQLALLVGTITLLVPIFAAFVLISPIVMICLKVFFAVLKVIVNMTLKMNPLKVTLGLMFIIGALGLVVIIASALWALSLISNRLITGRNLLNILAFFGSLVVIIAMITTLGVLTSLLTPIMPIVLLGLGMITIMVGSIVLIAISLMILQSIELDGRKIKENVGIVIDTAFNVIHAIFESTMNLGGSQEGQPWYKKVLSWMGGTAVMMLEAILGVGFLALSVVSVGLILFLATELRLLQTLDLNQDKIRENVNVVIDTAFDVIRSIFHRDSSEDVATDKSSFRSILTNLGAGPVLQIVDALMSVGFLALSVVSITLLSFLALQLRLLQTLDLNPDQIRDNVKTVIATAFQVIDAVNSPDTTERRESDGVIKKLLKFALPNSLVDMVDAISTIGFLGVSVMSIGLIKKLAEYLSSIATVEIASGINEKVKLIIESSYGVINSITSVEKVKIKDTKLLNKLSDSVEKVKNIATILNEIPNISNIDGKVSWVEKVSQTLNNIVDIDKTKINNTNKMMKNYSDFVKRVGDVDVENLKTASNMFEKMAEFSQSINGNFEKMADTLNEKIAPLMEELKALLEGVGEKVEDSGKKVSASTYAASMQVMTETQQREQLQREGVVEESELNEMLKTRLAQQAQQNYNLINKIDELVDLFRNGGARVALL